MHILKASLSAVCSTNGWMTVVTDLFRVLPNGKIPTGSHLSNKLCVAKDMDGTKVLYSIPLNSCGSVVKVRILMTSQHCLASQ